VLDQTAGNFLSQLRRDFLSRRLNVLLLMIAHLTRRGRIRPTMLSSIDVGNGSPVILALSKSRRLCL
jgi:hypothetical protein